MTEQHKNFEWTDEKIDLLRSLWASGLTARQIAKRLGNDVSRNAVIGKAHRLKLSASQIRLQTPESDTSVIAENPGIDFCQWPFGHPPEAGFKFCGKPVVARMPYCDEHCQVAYRQTADSSSDRRRLS